VHVHCWEMHCWCWIRALPEHPRRVCPVTLSLDTRTNAFQIHLRDNSSTITWDSGWYCSSPHLHRDRGRVLHVLRHGKPSILFGLAISAGLPSGLLFAAISYFYLPQSPRWLTFKGRGPVATAVWDKLGVSSTEREKDLEQRPKLRSEAVEATGTAKTAIFERIRQSMANFMAMFGKSTRKQMLLGVFMMSMQQLSGIDGIIYVGIKTFTEHTPNICKPLVIGGTPPFSFNKLESPHLKPHSSHPAYL
jgi:hypothetical protein